MNEFQPRVTEVVFRIEENAPEQVTEYPDGHWTAERSFTVSVYRCGSPGTRSPRT